MRLLNQWRYHRGKWSAVDYIWPDEGDGGADEMRDLGYFHVCSLSTVLDCEQALEAFVYEGRGRGGRKRFGGAEFIVQLVVDCTMHHVFLPDFIDLMGVMATIEPLVRTSIRTEQLVRFQDLRLELQRLLAEIDAFEDGKGWARKADPERGDVAAWLAERVGAPKAVRP